MTYTITNPGAPSMNWTASNSSSWLSLSSSGGTLAAGASTTVTASIAAPANSLGLGTYNDSIVFTNTTNGAGNATVSATLGVANEVQVAQPPQLTTYSGMVRGYWFTSPATFVISGLQVPTDASSGPQSIAVLKLTSTPPSYPSTTNSFTTLFLTQSNPASGIIPVNIQVNQGDIIGILGCRAEINSYGAAPFATQILGQPVTMARFGMQFPLDTTVPQSVWTDSTTGYLSRVNMYITGSTTAPIITSAFSASATLGQPFAYQIAATNSPTSYNANGLPSGLSVNTSTGVISGTPTGTGTSTVTMSATNASGTGTATLTINVLAAPPVITSTLTASGNTSTPLSYAITASNSPTSYSAAGLPSGLSVNTSTGVISGTPSAAGTSNVTISATNSGGTGSATLVLSIALGAPAITSPLSATAALNTSFSYSIAATGSPTSYNATGLPAGLSVNTSTGRFINVNGGNARRHGQHHFDIQGDFAVAVARHADPAINGDIDQRDVGQAELGFVGGNVDGIVGVEFQQSHTLPGAGQRRPWDISGAKIVARIIATGSGAGIRRRAVARAFGLAGGSGFEIGAGQRVVIQTADVQNRLRKIHRRVPVRRVKLASFLGMLISPQRDMKSLLDV